MPELSDLLKDANSSPTTKRELFFDVYKAGYYTGLSQDDAAKRFNAELLVDDPRRKELLGAGLPYYAERARLGNKFAKAAVCTAVGFGIACVGASNPRADFFDMLGAVMTVGCGSLAALYGIRRSLV